MNYSDRTFDELRELFDLIDAEVSASAVGARQPKWALNAIRIQARRLESCMIIEDQGETVGSCDGCDGLFALSELRGVKDPTSSDGGLSACEGCLQR